MKPLYTQEEFDKAKSDSTLLIACYNCNQPFKKTKKVITYEIIKNNRPTSCKFCSKSCYNENIKKTKRQNVICKQCNKEFTKQNHQINENSNHFCSQSCSTTYNNTHKTHGTRRSKLEIWLEEQLTLLYPTLHIDFNKKDTINSELDIYIPSLKLAFELNGIFHYEPIYGQNKLSKIQNNDQRKFAACIEKNISLCIIDASKLSYFKPIKAQKYLDIITNIINQNI